MLVVAGVIGSRPFFRSGTGSFPADETESVSPNSCCSPGVSSFSLSSSSSISILRTLPEPVGVEEEEALEVAFREPAATATGGLVAAVVVVVSFAASAAFLFLVVGGVVKGVFGGFIGRLGNVLFCEEKGGKKEYKSRDVSSRPPLFYSFFLPPLDQHKYHSLPNWIPNGV